MTNPKNAVPKKKIGAILKGAIVPPMMGYIAFRYRGRVKMFLEDAIAFYIEHLNAQELELYDEREGKSFVKPAGEEPPSFEGPFTAGRY